MSSPLITATAALLLSTAVVTWAGQGGPGRHEAQRGPGPGGIGRMLNNRAALDKLGLTEEQQAAIKTASYEFRKEMATLKADAELAEIELQKAMDEAAPDENAVMKAVDNVGTAKTAMQKAAVKHQLKVKTILGAEKVEALKAMQCEKMREKGEQRGQKFDRRFKARPEFMKMQGDGPESPKQEMPPEELE